MISPTHPTPTPLAWPHWLTSMAKVIGATFRQPTQSATASTNVESEPAQLTLRACLPWGQTELVCLVVEGALNCHTYTQLIETACTHYHQGQRGLLLDLRQTTQLELSGLFALLSIARLYNGQSLLDPEAGWAGLRQAVEAVTPALGERVKLLAPSPAAAVALQGANFCRFFTHYPDVETATAAFPTE